MSYMRVKEAGREAARYIININKYKWPTKFPHLKPREEHVSKKGKRRMSVVCIDCLCLLFLSFSRWSWEKLIKTDWHLCWKVVCLSVNGHMYFSCTYVFFFQGWYLKGEWRTLWWCMTCWRKRVMLRMTALKSYHRTAKFWGVQFSWFNVQGIYLEPTCYP